MECPGAIQQLFFRLDPVGIGHAAIDRTDRGALFTLEVPDAFGALLRDDIVEIVRKGFVFLAVQLPGNASGIDGGIRTLGFARTAIDTFLCYQRSHISSP
jgi:hypothetical protein